MRSIDPFVVALGLVTFVAGLSLHVGLGPRDTFWTIDNGGKALVLESLRTGAADATLSYPGRSIDPQLRWFPQPLTGSERYAVVRDGRIISQYASPFVWATWPFAVWFGFAGLAMLPALGGGLTVVATGLLAARTTGNERTAAAIALACSPLLFYSSVFWEHTLVVALAAFTFVALAGDSPRPGRAGVWIGLAMFLREELALLGLALVVVLIGRRFNLRSVARAAAGLGIGAGAGLVFQKVTTGSWSGVHVAVNPPIPFAHAFEAAVGLLFDPGFSGIPVAVSVALAILLLLGFSVRKWTPGLAILGGVGIGAIAVLAFLRFPGPEDSLLALIRSNSALVFLPWTLLAAPSIRERNPLPALVAWTFLAAFVLVVPSRSVTGIHPGPRMLLPLLPVFAVAAAHRLRGPRSVAWVLAVLLTVGATWNVRSLQLLGAKRHLAGDIARTLQSDPRRVVATDLFWLPTELAALWDDKQFHLLTTSDDLPALASAVTAEGEREMLVVVREGSIASEPIARVRDPRFPAFSADLHVQPLGGMVP